MINGIGISAFLFCISVIGGKLGLFLFFIFLFTVVGLTVQCIIVCKENKKIQKLFSDVWEVGPTGRIRSKELIFDIELFKEMEDDFSKENTSENEDIEIKIEMKELRCENLRIEMDNIKEINSATVNLLTISVAIVSAVIALCDSMINDLSISLVWYIVYIGILFIIIYSQQFFVSQKRLKTILWQYNYKKLEKMWLEKKLKLNTV